MRVQGERAQIDSRQKFSRIGGLLKCLVQVEPHQIPTAAVSSAPRLPRHVLPCVRMSRCALLAVWGEVDGLSLGQNVDAITMRLRIVEAFKETDSDGSGTVEPVGLNPAWRAVCCLRAQKQAPSSPVVVPLVLTIGARSCRRS